MSFAPLVLQVLELASVVSAATAALLSLVQARRAAKYKKTLSKVALSDPLTSAELVKFYRDNDLNEAEVRAIVRALTKAIERDLVDASEEVRTSLRGAQSLVRDETKTKGHRLFKELAARASSKIEHAA